MASKPVVSELEKAVQKLETERSKLSEKKKVAVDAASARAAKRFDDKITVINQQLIGLAPKVVPRG